ncbi:MAG: hypothetical protein ACRELB_16150 [Polyangiaceae bacterium]
MDVAGRRVFVAAWILLGLAGALDHTVAEKLFGRRFDLGLPHLKYGYVMFNVNPRTVRVYEYAGSDGVRRSLADLVAVPAPGYPRARLAVDATVKPEYLSEICYRATRAHHEEYDFFVSEYRVDVDPHTPSSTTTMHCGSHGLVAR